MEKVGKFDGIAHVQPSVSISQTQSLAKNFAVVESGLNKLKLSFVSPLVIPALAIVGQLHVPSYRYVY